MKKLLAFLIRYVSVLNQNVTDHWLVMPLEKTGLRSTHCFDDYLFLPEDISRNEKIQNLANLVSFPLNEMLKRADHTEKTRSPSFYDYSLLCHKIRHHTSWVRQYATHVVLFDLALLRVLDNLFAVEPQVSFEVVSHHKRESNHHILIHAESPKSMGTHSPLG